MDRFPTGVADLDLILSGGFPRNSTVLVCGVPGSGKTVLACQIAFLNATPESRALIISTVSEPMARAIQLVQGFSFFDMDKLGKAVIYEDAGPVLLEGDGERILEQIRELVMRHQPELLVVDTFKAIHDLSRSEELLRRTLYKLAATLASLSCTSLLVGEYDTGRLFEFPEAAIVDGIIELSNASVGLRNYRGLRVLKLRGSGYLPGYHSLKITADGLRVYPRFVTPAEPFSYKVSRERVKTGIAGLDQMLCGGLPKGSATLLAGDPGVGKTVTALHFLLNGAREGEAGLYISFQEDPNQLAQVAKNFGFDLKELQGKGLFQMRYRSPVEMDVEKEVAEIQEAADQTGPKRVVIDSVTDFEAGTSWDTDRYFNYLYSLVQHFKDRGITVLLTVEIGRIFDKGFMLTGGRGVSSIADNHIILRYFPDRSRIRRAITVLSVRGSSHSDRIREYSISEKQGPRVGDPLEANPFSPRDVCPNPL